MAGYRRRAREPRAHWILLALGMVVLLAELMLHGLIQHVGAEGVAAEPPAAEGEEVPAALLDGGPVVRIDDGGTVITRGMPDKTIALTFDDGPDPKWTPQVLDLLKAHGAKATFFVIGSRVNQYPDLTRRIVAEGHELGVHTFTHEQLASVPTWRRDLELSLSLQAIAAATGQSVGLMRPPYSSGPDAVTPAEYAAQVDAARAGYLVVLADHDTKDWSRPGVDAIVKAARPADGRGAVVMLHDGGGDRAETVAALGQLLTELTKKDYAFTTVSAGLALGPPATATTGQKIRGEAMWFVQRAADWLSGAMVVLLNLAIGLALVRLVVQLVTARIHRRRHERRSGGRLAYLGPVTVIVPAYNEAANIADTVRSLIGSDYPRVEVIVVDDGSTDGTAEVVRRLRLPHVYVIRQENAGKPAALNNGIRHARTELVILVDGDTVFERDAVGRLVQSFLDPEVGAVSGNTKVANRDGLLGRWQHLEYVMGFNLDRRMFEVGECMPTVPGAIGGFRREALLDIGGVPTVTLAEDTDLTMALIRAGWRVVYEQSAVAWTEAPATLRQLWRQRYRWCFGTMQAMWKHRRSLIERGPSGRLGRRGLGYLLGFQILLPLAAPAVDVYAIYGLFFLPLASVAAVWFGFLLLQVLTAAYALRMDGERFTPLWTMPLQQIVYRQLMYLVVFQSTITALSGIRLGWQRIARRGVAGLGLEQPSVRV